MAGVNIRVRADTTAARRDLSKLEGSVRSIDKTTKNVTRSLTRLAAGIATAFGGTIAIKSINNATNSLIELENRVALVTGRSEQLNKSLDNLYKIARQSRQPVELAAETFNRFGIALRESGVSVAEIEKATLSVQRAVSLSGGNIESARAAIFQLGQGLASGTLRGQELNSVLEQAPRVALAIADNMGVGVGELRKLAAEGKVTTDEVFQALLNQSSKLESEFQALNQTSSQAFTVLSDSLKRTTGEISRTLGVTNSFTNTFNKLSDSIIKNSNLFELGLYANISSFNRVLENSRIILGGVINVFEAFASRVFSSLTNIIGPLSTLSLTIEYLLLNPIDKVYDNYDKLIKSLTRLFERDIFKGTSVSLEDIFKIDTAENTRKVLDTLAEDIRLYGRRWYNFGYQITSFLDSISTSLDNFVIRIGIILKRFNLYRYTILDFIQSFKAISTAKDIVISALHEIERAFFFVYDKVIGNSWWTDTMEKTQFLAEKHLNKTKDIVKSFADYVVNAYNNIYNKAVSSLSGLNNNFTSLDLKINFDSSSIKSNVENVINFFKNNVGDLVKDLSSRIGIIISEFYQGLRDISPALASVVSTSVVLAVIGTLNSGFRKGLQTLLKGGLIIGIGVAIADAISSSLLDSKAIKDFAFGLGKAAGTFIDLIISNIPELVRALGQVAVGFAQGIADSLSGIPGLIAKAITAIPIVNLLPSLLTLGLAAYFTGSGPKKLIDNFISNRQSAFDKAEKSLAKKASKSANNLQKSIPQISFFESVLIGRGSGRATLAKYSAGLLVADTLLRQVFGDKAINDIIVAGGAVASLLYGTKTHTFVISTAQQVFSSLSKHYSAFIALTKTQGLSATLINAIGNFASNYETKLQSAGRAIGKFKQKNNSIISGTKDAFSRMANVTSNAIQSPFLIANKSINRASRFARRNAGKLAVGLAAAFTIFATQADAATSSVEENTKSLFERLNDFLATPLGFLGTMFLGTVGLGTLGNKIGTAAASLTGRILSTVGSVFKRSKLLKAGALSLAILGEGSIIAGITTVIGAALSTLLAGITSLVAAVLAITAGLGVLYVGIFGEGDSFSNRLGNAYDDIRRFFGFSSRAAKNLKKDLNDAIGGFDKIDNINVNFKPLIDSFNFEDVNSEETKRLQKIARRTNKILEESQRSFEENGELSSSERRRLERAVDLARIEIVNSNRPDLTGNESSSGANLLLESISQFRPLLSNTLGLRGSFETEISNALDLEAVSDSLKANLEGLGSAVNVQSLSYVQQQINSILQDNADELSASASGKAFVNLLETLQSLSSGLNKDFIDVDTFNAIFENAAALSSVFDAAEADTRNPNLTQAEFEQRREINEAALNAVIREAQRSVRVKAEEDFLAAAKRLEDLIGPDVFDLSDVDKFKIRVLDTATLDQLEKEITDQADKIAASYSELEADNIKPTQLRKHLVERYEAATGQLLTNVLDRVGLTEDGGEAVDIKGRLDRINDLLNELDIDALNVLPSSATIISGLVDKEGRKIENSNQKILSQLSKIDVLKSKILKTDQEDTNAINAIIKELSKEKKLLELLVSEQNALSLAQVDRIAAIEGALDKVEDSFSLNKVLAFEPSKITEVLKLSAAVDYLAASLARIQLLGEGKVDLGIVRAIERQLNEAQEKLNNTLSAPDLNTDKDKSGETVFEKFVGGLSDSGFAFDLKTASSLSRKAVESINKPLKEIEKAQKAIVNSSLEDSSLRQKSLNTIKESRKEIFKILQSPDSTVGQMQIGLEAMGLDPQLVFERERAFEISNEILTIQEKINNLSSGDVNTRMELNKQLEYQTKLLDGITNKAEQSANKMKDTFANGLSSLIKEGGKIEDFFEGFLDSLSNEIIDTVVNSFVDSFFKAAGLQEMFDTLFSKLFDSSSQFGNKLGEDTKTGFDQAAGDISQTEGFFGKLTKGFQGVLSGLKGGLGSIFESITGIFGGSGGGGLSSLLNMGLSFFGFPALPFNNGGIVPNTPYSKIGVDSVPAMLTPGEMIIPADKVKSMNQESNRNTQQFNINVQGDVSRQTRKEIVRMIPQITSGVNMTNKENNYKRF